MISGKDKDVLFMKKTIVICVTILLCIAMMCGSFIYVGKDFNETIGKLIPSVSVSSKDNNDKTEPETAPVTEHNQKGYHNQENNNSTG